MSNEFIQIHPMIIPTVLIPLTAISVLLSSVAVFIAGLFGLKLKAEGPKKLLEVLLKPRILLAAIVLNLVIWGGVRGFFYVTNASSLDVMVHFRQSIIKTPSDINYPDIEKSYSKNLIRTKGRRSSFEVRNVWERKLPKGAFSSPVISGDSVFVGSDDGYIYEVSFVTGEVLRRFYIGTEVSPSPIIYGGFLYSGEGSHDTHHARISKFDLKTGDYVGSFRTIGHVEGQINIDTFSADQPLLFASAGVGGVYAIDPINMKGIWTSNLGHADGGVRVDGEMIYFGTGREKYVVDKYRSWAIALKAKTGELAWKREMPASSWMLPVVTNDRSCFVFGEIYFASEVGGVACFQKSTGESAGVFYHNAPIVADPLILDNDLFVVDLNGSACRVSLQNMKMVWCRKANAGGRTYAGVRYDPGTDTLIQVSRKDGIYILDPDTGNELAKWPKLKEENLASFAPVAIDPRGWVFIGEDGDLVRLNAEATYKVQAQK